MLKRSFAFGAVALMACMATGCFVVAVNPWYTEADLVFEEAFLGDWEADEDDPDGRMSFEKDGDKQYKVTFYEDDKSAELIGRVAKIHDVMYLDLTVDIDEIELDDMYLIHLLPLHSIAKIAIEDEKLHLAFMNAEWLSELADDGKLGAKYISREDMPVLTGTTQELQTFLKKHADNEEAFIDPLICRRTGAANEAPKPANGANEKASGDDAETVSGEASGV